MDQQINFAITGVCYPDRQAAQDALRSGDWLDESAGDLIRSQARRQADRTFIVFEDTRLTYREFDDQTEILAASLLEIGLAPGDRAVFQMGTVPETLVALFACFKAGVVPICSLPQHREVEVDFFARNANAKAYFVQADFSDSFDLGQFASSMSGRHGINRRLIVARGRHYGHLSLDGLLHAMPVERARTTLAGVKIGPRDVLAFQLSGGSTGVPKLIPRFHGEYLGQAAGLMRRHAFVADDIALWPLPLIHNAAMQLMVIPTIVSGGTLVLQRRFETSAFLAAIAAHRVTVTGSIGPIAPSLLETPGLDEPHPTLRMFFTLDRAASIEDHLQTPVVTLYGITEGLLLSSAPHDPAWMRFDTMGYPTGAGDEIRVLAPDSERPVPEGEEGELCFKGSFVLRNYFGAPDESARSFTSDGFFRTGDLGRLLRRDDQTSFRFTGRLKDNISRGGEKFSAEEVERMIVTHPSVADAKVVAVPDPILGERACAFVIPSTNRPCPSVGELDRFLTDAGLARYKHPEYVEPIGRFPTTNVGKVDKAALRKQASRHARMEHARAS